MGVRCIKSRRQLASCFAPMPERSASEPSSPPSSSSSKGHVDENRASLRALHTYRCPGLDEYDDDETLRENQAFLEYFKELCLQHRKLVRLIETAQRLSLSFMDSGCHVSTQVAILLEKTIDDVFYLLRKAQELVDELDALKVKEEHNVHHRASQLSSIAHGYNEGHFVIMRLLKHGGGKKGHSNDRSTPLLKSQKLSQVLSTSIETLDYTSEKAEEFQEAVASAFVAADDAYKTCKDINYLWKKAGERGKNYVNESFIRDCEKDLASQREFDNVLKESRQRVDEVLCKDTADE